MLMPISVAGNENRCRCTACIAIALLIMLVCMSVAYANDGVITGEGGTLHMMSGEHPAVRMVRERVQIDVYPGYYDVAADFFFYNEGDAVTVKMGFPESGGGDIDGRYYVKNTGFLKFATTVDGKGVTARRTASTDKISGDYDAYWVKEVSFTRGQRRHVRVMYRAKPGAISSGEHTVTYQFTGGNWKGTVKESLLTVKMNLPGESLIWFPQPDKNNAYIYHRRSESSLAFKWSDWQAQRDFYLSYMTTYHNWFSLEGLSADLCGHQHWVCEYMRTLNRQPGTVRMVLPGKPAEPDWAPDVIERGGTLFIQLKPLSDFLSRPPKEGKRSIANLYWDGKKMQAILSTGNRTLYFSPGSKKMIVSGTETVLMPAAAFLSYPIKGYAGVMYVPAGSVLNALGRRYILDRKNRTLSVLLASTS